MALASQSYRSTRSSSSRRKFPVGRFTLVVAVIIVVGGGYWMWRPADESSEPVEPAPFREPTITRPVTTPESLEPTVSPTETDTAPRTALEAAIETIPEGTPVGDAEADPAADPDRNPASDPGTMPPPDAGTDTARRPVGNGFDGETAVAPPAAAGAADASFSEALALAASDPVRARAALSKALLSDGLSPREAKQAADALNAIGRELTLTPVLNANDPTFFRYEIESGDSLQKIVRKHKLGCDWRLIQRINNIKRPEAIRIGQKVKLPKGPFTAVVHKRDYRIDLCIGAGDDRVVFASLPVGLGSANGTPIGRFRVRPGSKLLDPEWRHPVTGEYFASDDPKNPIGEHWLGLEGIDATNEDLLGYGIHGTIEIDSIGQDRSLGCVRMLADDVALVWESLGDGCEVEIRP